MDLNMKGFSNMGVHRKIQFLEGVHEKAIYRGNCLKRGGGLGHFSDLKGGLAKKRGLGFLRGGEGLIPQCTL